MLSPREVLSHIDTPDSDHATGYKGEEASSWSS